MLEINKSKYVRVHVMSNKDIVKYFYEVVVSENLLNELPQYI